MNSLHTIKNTKNFKTILIGLFFTLSALAWLFVEIYNHYNLSTDDAYINANIIQVAPRISGKVVKLYVNDNDYVKKGQPLFDIDDAPYQLEVTSAKAQLALSSVELDNANATEKRTLALVNNKYLSPQEGDNVTARQKTATAKVEEATARLAEANLNLSYTHVVAQESGWISNLSLRVGDMVTTNQSLFALISDEEFWADANFKETQMATLKPGQLATIVTDLYPDHPFKGVIKSISNGAGNAFSLLPAENATGNWVKVTQRIPVRVQILNPDPSYPLRVGASANVTIKLQQFLNSHA